MKLFISLTFSLTLFLVACADQSSRSIENQLESIGFGIQGGELVSTAKDPVTKEVKSVLAQLRQDGFKPHCAGVLIAPRLVLTAAHCLYDDDTYDWIKVKDLKVGTCIDKKSEACGWASVESFVVHEGYHLMLIDPVKRKEQKIDSDNNHVLQNSRHDLALVLLKSSAATKTFIPHAKKTPEIDSDLFTYGSGRTQKDTPLDRKMRTVKLKADRSYKYTIDGGDTIGRYMAIHSKEMGVCYGDSGGPVFNYQDDQLVLSGLNAGVLNNKEGLACDSTAAMIVDVSQYAKWTERKSEQLLGAAQRAGYKQ